MKANCKLPAQLHEPGKGTMISELKWLKPLAIRGANLVPLKLKRYFVYHFAYEYKIPLSAYRVHICVWYVLQPTTTTTKS